MTSLQTLLALALLAALATAGWLGREPLELWTRDRLLAQQQQRLAELPEAGAASLIEQLATDDRYLLLVARSLEDARPLVAAAAERGLTQMVARWERMSADESSPHVADLAAALAQCCGKLPAERRRFAHALARQLLERPIGSRRVDAGKLIANCETVLRQQLPVQQPLRFATHIAEPEAVAAPLEDVPEMPADVESLPPIVSATLPPALLIDANRETPLEPRQFLAPRAARLSDEVPAAER